MGGGRGLQDRKPSTQFDRKLDVLEPTRCCDCLRLPFRDQCDLFVGLEALHPAWFGGLPRAGLYAEIVSRSSGPRCWRRTRRESASSMHIGDA